MKETDFVRQNEEKWSRFEYLYARNRSHPKELSDLYVDLTNDLSYAQTYYRRRTVRVYLNQLAQVVFTSVHNIQKPSTGGMFNFWFKNLPNEIYQSRKNIQLALVSFLLYAFVGIMASIFIPDFLKLILGEEYVVVTLQNIKNGNPLGIYDSSSQFEMFTMIATNNLKVALLMFSAGYLMTLGTHYFLFTNGVMIGAFQYFFYSQGLLETSFLGIWIHGAFEVSCLVIAAGAGITAGKGWMFPKSHTRFQAFQLATKRAVKLVLSLVPFILLAAFLESYVTHNYDVLPAWSKWLIILGSFGIICFFYFLFPLLVSRTYQPSMERSIRFQVPLTTSVSLYIMRTATELITEAFKLYRLGFSEVVKVLFIFLLPLGIGLIFFQEMVFGSPSTMDSDMSWYDHLPIMLGVSKESPPMLVIFGLWTLFFSVVFSACGYVLNSYQYPNQDKGLAMFLLKKTPLFWFGGMGLWVCIMLPVEAQFLTLVFLPCIMYQAPLMGMDERSFAQKLFLGSKMLFVNWKTMVGAIIYLVVFLFILMQPIAGVFSVSFGSGEVFMPDLLDVIADHAKNIALGIGWNPEVVAGIVRKCTYLIVLMFLLPYLSLLCFLHYYTIIEKKELISLKRALVHFGNRKKAFESTTK
jgi:uncharacterized membrane protein SpoIIM required for sporulation